MHFLTLGFLVSVTLFSSLSEASRRGRYRVPMQPKYETGLQNNKTVELAVKEISQNRRHQVSEIQVKSMEGAAVRHAGPFTRLVVNIANRTQPTALAQRITQTGSRIAEVAKSLNTIQLAGSGLFSVVNSMAHAIKGSLRPESAKKVATLGEQVATRLEAGESPAQALSNSPAYRTASREQQKRFKNRCR